MDDRKKNIKKIIARVFIIMAISLLYLAATFLLVYLIINAKTIFNEQFTGYIEEKTNYSIRFDEPGFDLAKRKVTLKNLYISPGQKLKDDSISTQFYFNTNELSISNIKILPLIRESRFVAALIELNNPEISLESGEKISLENIQKERLYIGDTLNIPVLQEVFFDTLRVSDASIQLDSLFNTPDSMPAIYLEATHFKLGGRKYTNTPYPFDVSDLSIIVKNIHQSMPDSLHSISVEQINLSLLNQDITAKKVHLKPLSDTIAFENLYTIYMPEIYISTSMAAHMLQSDTIAIHKMIVKKPSIDIKFGTKVQQGTPINEINLHKLIENKLKWVNIEHFSIENANLQLVPAKSENVAQKFENISLNFFNFRADSSSYRDPGRIISAESIDVDMEKFTLNHTDQIHQLIIEDIAAYSNTKSISTGEILFTPLPGIDTLNVGTTIYTHSKSIMLSGVDFHAFYHDQIIPMDEFTIESPVTNVGIQQKLVEKGAPKDKSIILEKTSDYLKGIYVNNTIINDGTLTYRYLTEEDKAGFFFTRYEFNLSHLSVDSTTFYQTDKIFFADNFDVIFSEVKLQLADGKHKLNVDSLKLSSKGKQAEIIQLVVKPLKYEGFENSTDQFDITFPLIKFSGANLHHAFFYKELYISNLSIYKPVFNLEKYSEWSSENRSEQDIQNEIYHLISDYLQKVSIKNLQMHNGLLNINQQTKNLKGFNLSNYFSIKMFNFEIDALASTREQKLFFSEEIDLVLNDHSFTLADGVHKVFAKEIGILSSDDKIYIKNANLYPDILSPKFDSLHISFFANIPSMQISNADIFGIFNKGSLAVNEINIDKPSIKLLYKTNIEKDKDKNKKPAIILEDLKTASVQTINIKNGQLELASYENNESKTFANANIDFRMDKFAVSQANGIFSYNYDDFYVNFNHFDFDLPDKLHTVNIGTIKYKLSERKIKMDKIALVPLKTITNNNKNQLFELIVPELSLSEIDFDNYMNNNKLEAGVLLISNPSLSVSDNRIEKENKLSAYKFNMFPALSSFAESATADIIKIQGASYSFKPDKTGEINNINIDAKGFRIDENEPDPKRLLNCDEVELSVSDITQHSTDGFFKFHIDNVKINHEGNFSINGASLTPTINRDEFARIKQYQADYFFIDNADIKGSKLDIEKFIENNDIIIDKLEADFHNVSIHRDKTYPLHPAQSPPMPQQAIRNMKQKMNIANASITAKYFKYTELESDALDTGYVFFTNVSAMVSNISNINISENPIMPAKIEALLMGEGKTVINSTWNLYSFNNEFSLNATCEEMPLSLLNPITEPSLNLSIKEGINRKLEASFEANGDSSVGTLKFAYNDLKVSILNTRDGEIREGKFVSFLVNTLALKSDNPRRGRILLPARFTFHRDKQRSIVGYSWKSIYSGIQSALGIKQKESTEETDQNNNN
jgi:hypothetical protein